MKEEIITKDNAGEFLIKGLKKAALEFEDVIYFLDKCIKRGKHLKTDKKTLRQTALVIENYIAANLKNDYKNGTEITASAKLSRVIDEELYEDLIHFPVVNFNNKDEYIKILNGYKNKILFLPPILSAICFFIPEYKETEFEKQELTDCGYRKHGTFNGNVVYQDCFALKNYLMVVGGEKIKEMKVNEKLVEKYKEGEKCY